MNIFFQCSLSFGVTALFMLRALPKSEMSPIRKINVTIPERISNHGAAKAIACNMFNFSFRIRRKNEEAVINDPASFFVVFVIFDR
jgi:hypothetical protein